MKLGVIAPRWTYSAACAGFKIACNGSTVDPSEISANAKRFCFRTDRMNPLILTSLSSKVHGPSALLAWRICAHRRAAIRECGVVLEPSLATDVAKVRRHVCMAESRALGWESGMMIGGSTDGLGKPRSVDSAGPITALVSHNHTMRNTARL